MEEFFRWEMATAAAGAVLKLNPFDQPNVELAKQKARQLMAEFEQTGVLPGEAPTLDYDDIDAYGPVMGATLTEALAAFLSQYRPGDYVAIMAYVPYHADIDAALGAVRQEIRAVLRTATTVGYGPRFLHSTGQLHKGDAGHGLFIQITEQIESDLPIPDQPGGSTASMSFGILIKAQALGDRQALLNANRKVIRIHFEGNTARELKRLAGAF